MKRILVFLLLLGVPGVAADIQGDCEVFIQGQDVRGRSDDAVADALVVHVGDNVTYEVLVPGPAKRFQLIAEVGPYEVVLDDRNFTAGEAVTRITGNTTFEGLPGGAAGAYRYRGEVTQWNDDGCVGSMLVRIVPASPFTPVLIGAVAAAGAGGTALMLLIVRGYQDGREIFDVVKDYADEARHMAGLAASEEE